MVKNLPAKQEMRVQALCQKAPGEGNGNPLQYSCLGNPMDRGIRQGCPKEMDRTERLSKNNMLEKTLVLESKGRSKRLTLSESHCPYLKE